MTSMKRAPVSASLTRRVLRVPVWLAGEYDGESPGRIT
jgi:hypothetical protein